MTLPFDNRPWAKTLARTVIALSVCFAALGAYYFYSEDELHIPEVTIIVLLLLTIVPPNVAVLLKKPEQHGDAAMNPARLHSR